MDAFEQLKQERTNLLARLSQIESVLAEHEALQIKVNALLSTGGDSTTASRARPTKSGEKSESHGRRVSADVAEFERAILEILAVSNHPLDRGELYEIAVSRNLDIGGKDPLNTLASRMSRMQGVTNIRGQGYLLQSRMSEFRHPQYGANDALPLEESGSPPQEITADLDDILNL